MCADAFVLLVKGQPGPVPERIIGGVTSDSGTCPGQWLTQADYRRNQTRSFPERTTIAKMLSKIFTTPAKQLRSSHTGLVVAATCPPGAEIAGQPLPPMDTSTRELRHLSDPARLYDSDKTAYTITTGTMLAYTNRPLSPFR